MEREYTIGALLILVVIFVIALIIYFTVPEFNEDVKQIADEVFGVSAKAKQADVEFYEQEQAKKVLESVRKCVDQLKKSKEGCTCYLEYNELPKDYYIRLTENLNELKLEKGNIIVKDSINIPDIKDKFCILKKDFTGSKLTEYFKIHSETGKLGIDTKEFPDNTPQFYNIKEGDNLLMCFVTDNLNEEEIKKIREIKDCETEKNIAKENMLKFFNEFVNQYERCKAQQITDCLCDILDFNKLLDGYEIFVQQDVQNKETTFSLFYAKDKQYSEKIGTRTVKNSILGVEKIDLLQNEVKRMKEWQEEGFWSRIPYLFKKEGDRVWFMKQPSPEDMVKCAPEYVICKDCDMPTDRDRDIMLKRLKGEGDKILYTYKGTPYKKLIEDLITDPYMRLLVASIIPGESGFYNEAEGKDPKTGKVVDKGLMQFNEGTAPGFPDEKYWKKCLEKEKQCFVCSKPGEGGCNKQDNRKNPYITIPAAAQLLKENLQQFDKYTDKELFAIAAYNTGPDDVNKAIKKIGKSNPSWEEVRKKLSKGVACYPCNVEYYKEAFASEFNIPISTSTSGKAKVSCWIYKETECYNHLADGCYPDLTAKGFFSACKYCEDNFVCGQVMVEKLCNMNPCSKTCKWEGGACFAK